MKHSSVVIELIETNSHLTSFIQLHETNTNANQTHFTFPKIKTRTQLEPKFFFTQWSHLILFLAEKITISNEK